MKLEYLKLVNFAFINAGMRIPEIELDFRKAPNTINLIIGNNGTGKTGLLSNIHPFATLGHIDARDDSDLIIEGENGYKKCIYSTKKHEYEIEHFYKMVGKTRIISSYIKKDGKELNPPGTVRSFLDIIQKEFDIDINFLKLIRLGGNVTNFVELNSSGRIQFIGKMLSAISKYLKANKIMRARGNALKANLENATEKLEKLNISDISLFRANIEKKVESLISLRKERDDILAEYYTYTGKMSKPEYLTYETDMSNAISENEEFEYKRAHLVKPSYMHINEDDLASTYQQLADNAIKKRVNAAENMSKLSADIQVIENDKKRLEYILSGALSRNEIAAYEDNIKNYEDEIADYKETYKPIKYTMEQIKKNLDMINLIYFQLKDCYTVGDDIGYYMSLYKKFDGDLNAIDEYARNRIIVLYNEINQLKASNDFTSARNESLIMFVPSTCQDFKKCPYYNAFGESDRDKTESELSDLENELKAAESVSGILSSVYNIQKYISMMDQSVDITTITMDNVNKCLAFRDNIYLVDAGKIKEVINQIELSSHIKEVEEKLIDMKKEYKYRIESKDGKTQEDIESELEAFDKKINKLDKERNKWKDEIIECNKTYEHYMKCLKDYNIKMEYERDYEILTSKIKEVKERIKNLESISEEAKRFNKVKSEYDNKISFINTRIDELEKEIDESKVKDKMYMSLTSEIDKIVERYDDVIDIRNATSQSEGIPLIHIKVYCRALCTVANQIIKSIYTGDFYLKSFDVDDNSFKIPYVTKGITVKDIRNGSQAEVSVAKLAISFAMLSQFMTKYNIPLFDEVDGPLHQVNKEKFFSSIEGILSDVLKCDQAFMITQSSMYNDYPVNFIVTDPEYRNMIPNDAYVIFQR